MRPTGKSVAAAAVQAVGMGYTYDEMDCQAFVEYCVKQAGGQMDYRGSNDMARNAVWLGTLENAKAAGKLVPGAGMLIHEDTEANLPAKYRGDGLGDFSHVGLYVGENALTDTDKNGRRRACDVVHSSATMGRVAGSTLQNGWTHALWFSEIDYAVTAGAGAGADGANADGTGAGTGGTGTGNAGAGTSGTGTGTSAVTSGTNAGGTGAGAGTGGTGAGTSGTGTGTGAGTSGTGTDTNTGGTSTGVTGTTSAPGLTAGAVPAAYATVTSPDGGPVKLRKSASRGESLYWLVGAGARVRVERTRDGWSLVTALCTDGYTRRAWMMDAYLRR